MTRELINHQKALNMLADKLAESDDRLSCAKVLIGNLLEYIESKELEDRVLKISNNQELYNKVCNFGR